MVWPLTAQSPAATERLRLPMGTLVSLELMSELNPRDLEVGYLVDLRVRVDVVVNGEVLIRTGAYAEGVVKEVEARRSPNSRSRLVIEAVMLQAADGQLVPLLGEPLEREGKGRQGWLAKGLILHAQVLHHTPVQIFSEKNEPALGTSSQQPPLRNETDQH